MSCPQTCTDMFKDKSHALSFNNAIKENFMATLMKHPECLIECATEISENTVLPLKMLKELGANLQER